jgi:meso-butanediol dehydrogenase/(S,S)-butanediol dehydrogenase/diacetyl reductase
MTSVYALQSPGIYCHNFHSFSTNMTVLLIVGASRGIGLACVRHALSLANVRVFGVARNEAKLSALADELQKPERFDWLAGDITDRNVCRRAVEHCVKRFGRLDAVIQNAG